MVTVLNIHLSLTPGITFYWFTAFYHSVREAMQAISPAYHLLDWQYLKVS